MSVVVLKVCTFFLSWLRRSQMLRAFGSALRWIVFVSVTHAHVAVGEGCGRAQKSNKSMGWHGNQLSE